MKSKKKQKTGPCPWVLQVVFACSGKTLLSRGRCRSAWRYTMRLTRATPLSARSLRGRLALYRFAPSASRFRRSVSSQAHTHKHSIADVCDAQCCVFCSVIVWYFQEFFKERLAAATLAHLRATWSPLRKSRLASRPGCRSRTRLLLWTRSSLVYKFQWTLGMLAAESRSLEPLPRSRPSMKS